MWLDFSGQWEENETGQIGGVVVKTEFYSGHNGESSVAMEQDGDCSGLDFKRNHWMPDRIDCGSQDGSRGKI